jgi:hypothetical protein
MRLHELERPANLNGEIPDVDWNLSQGRTAARPEPDGEAAPVPGRILFKFGQGNAVVWVRINSLGAGDRDFAAGRDKAPATGNPAGETGPGG